jgi:NAD(P)H dehydrogenase (quinone)
MRALVIVAHPRRDSFSHHLAGRAADGLRAGGHDVEVLDLCAEGFSAAMSAAEREAYHTDRPILDPLVERHAELIGRAELVVFVYPTWWSTVPAVLKGWLERVLVPGVAFGFDARGKVRPALQLRRIVGVSTYGSSAAQVRLVNDNGRRTLTRALRLSCRRGTRTSWLAMYSLDTSTPVARAEFAARVERSMAELR